MHAIQISPNGQIDSVELEKPIINDNEILIKTLGCGICGTDLLKINLKLLKQPTVLGHEICGRVTKTGKYVRDFNIGDLVVVAHHVPCFDCHYCHHQNYSMCDTFKRTNLNPGGFSEYVKISPQHLKHTTFKIPENMAWQEATFTEPLACCVRNIDRLPLLKGDTVIIVGLGSIGLMMAKLLKRLECSVIGIDLDQKRCDNSLNYGIDFACNSQHQTITQSDSQTVRQSLLENKLNDITENRGADGIIFTAGPAKMLNESLSWLRNGGFVNLFAHMSGEKTEIDTAELYHRELQIITTYSPSPQALKKSFEILKNENLKLREMFQSYPPHQFEQAIEDINKRNTLKALITF